MSWNHGYALDEYQTRKINGGDHGITWRDIFKCQSFTEMLFGVPWSQRSFLIFHRMGELRESREAANTIREAARAYGKEINKDIVAAKILSQILVARSCLSDSSNCFSPLQTLIP